MPKIDVVDDDAITVTDAVACAYSVAILASRLLYDAGEADAVDDRLAAAIEESRVAFVQAFDTLDLLVRPLGIHIDPEYEPIQEVMERIRQEGAPFLSLRR